MRVIVILAGGAGERFWPMSRAARPKQLLTLTSSGQSLLEEAVERAKAVVPAEDIYIATSEQLQQPIIDSNFGIPSENVLAEPSKRNTAGCLIYASASILARYRQTGPEGVTIGVLTADHRIPDTVPFAETAKAALEEAENNDALITIGIQPIRPETGYGYLKVDKTDKSLNQNEKFPLYKVNSFTEKPDAATAAKFIAEGHCYWNSGMFFWRLSTFQTEFNRANPILAETLEDLTDAIMANDNQRAKTIFDAMPNISIDYALMEKSDRINVIPGNFLWDDLGNWQVLQRTFPQDASGNVSFGNPLVMDCSGSIVYNACGEKQIAVAAVGLKDMVVVVENDAVLVMPKTRTQDVRDVVAALRARDAKQL
ncbi:MAG: NTP transferase domain-containing protein [Lentisphaeria bacterium]|nr:NTP transferase domain-containing protein [Lentisphaeria bacterium]